MLHVFTPIRLSGLPSTTRPDAHRPPAVRKGQEPPQSGKPRLGLAARRVARRTDFAARQAHPLAAAAACLLGLPEHGLSPRLSLPRGPAIHPSVVEAAQAQLAQPL